MPIRRLAIQFTTVVALVALSILSTAAPCPAASITYALESYPNLQFGDTLAGFITTDGAIGNISYQDIKAYSIEAISNLGVVLASESDPAPTMIDAYSIGLVATATTITLPESSFAELVLGSLVGGAYVVWSNGSGSEYAFLTDKDTSLWNDEVFPPAVLLLGGSTWLIASTTEFVPEPASIIGMAMGLAAVGVVAGVRRRKNG